MLRTPHRAPSAKHLLRRAGVILGVGLCLALPAPATSALGQVTSTPDADHALAFAIVTGDSAEVARCLAADPGAVSRKLGAPPNPRGNGYDARRSALALAVRNHQVEAARLLLEAGAAPSGVGDEGRALLRDVAFPEILDLLVEHGLDAVEASGDSASLGGELGDTPRHRALARALVRHGVTCDLEDAVRLGLDDHLDAQLGTGEKRASLLYLAIERQAPGLVQRLLEAGCALSGPPPESRYSNWDYPSSVVQFALFRGRSDDAIALLDRGAVARRSEWGWESMPGLHVLDSREWVDEEGDLLDRAIDLGSAELVERLVARGFDLAARGGRGAPDAAILADRALRASWRGQPELVRRLLEAAAAMRIELDHGPLELAAATAGHDELARTLAERSEHASPHAAAVRGAWDELAAILDADPAALERPDPRCGGTPLGWAVVMGRTEVAARLLERGAQPEVAFDTRVSRARWEGRQNTTFPIAAGDHRTSSLIGVAIGRGDLALAEVLLRAGARLDPPALGKLAASPVPDVTEVLHDALGIPLETLRALRCLGATVAEPAAIALGWSVKEVVQAYVRRLTEQEWRSALHAATRRPSPDTYRRLFEAREVVTVAAAVEQVHSLAYEGRMDLIEVALTRTAPGYDLVADPEVLENGARHPAFVKELLARGANPNGGVPDRFGPLHHAAGGAMLDSVELLLRAGADPNARSFNGRVPLYELTVYLDGLDWGESLELEERALGTIAALLAAGADPLSVDDVGRVVFETLLWHDWSQGGEQRLRALLARHVDPSWL